MNRRVSGLVLLLAAVLAVVVVPAVYHPGVAGRPSAAPLPGPPAVGTCLLVQDAVPTAVDCTAPHDLEVTAGFEAGAAEPSVAQCQARAADYVAPVRVGDWLVPLGVDVAVVPAPAGERLGDRGWQVCTLRPQSHDRYAGSVRGMTLATYRSDIFGNCFDTYPGPKLSCDTAHDAELLASAEITYTDPQLAGNSLYYGLNSTAVKLPDSALADLTQRCTVLATDLTGSTDPTYGNQLGIRMFVRSVFPTERNDTVQVYLACVAISPGGHPLAGSVIGLGTQPLPFG